MSTAKRPPVSVLLPTTEWGLACEQVAAMLGPEDELLVLCDRESDPVASHDPPAGVRILVAGEPVGCSGKANAIAHGLEQARHDRFVWTDDDFDRAPDWLDRLVRASERRGPLTITPAFDGGGWWRLAEPALVLYVAYRRGLVDQRAGAFPWGGGVTFRRSDLRDGVAALVADLRTSLSDDAVLADHLEGCVRDESMVVTVQVDGDCRSVTRRLVRYARTDHVREGLLTTFVLSLVVAMLAVLAPLPMALLVTLLVGSVATRVGRSWSSALLAYPALLVLPVFLGAGLCRETFVWAGRRYRLRSDGTVEILGETSR